MNYLEVQMVCFFRKVFILLLILDSSILLSEESFINQKEYGKQLYNDPRGVGCNKCHGEDGRGMSIAKYISEKGKEVELKSPDITNIDYKTFLKSLKVDSYIMPRYYLTDNEIEAIYDYINVKKDSNERDSVSN